MFCTLSQNYQHILTNDIYITSYSKFSKELTNYKLAKRFLSYGIDQNNTLTVMIRNIKPAWPSKMSMPFSSKMMLNVAVKVA